MESDQLTPGGLFVERSTYYLTREYPGMIRGCVAALPEAAVWARAGESSNSIGNLLLHLAGNVRQWIVGGVGGHAVERDRPAEFAARGGASADVLLGKLDGVLREAAAVLPEVREADLIAPRLIQGYDTTVLGAIYHVVEHFSMHTGQIVMMTKARAPDSVRFYDAAGQPTEEF